MVLIIFNLNPLNENPYSIYIRAIGILSFLFLPIYFLPNIMTFGFEINWLSFNRIFCKFQMSYAVFTITSIFFFNCFISFDQYSIISLSPKIRLFNSIKLSRYHVLISLILIWFIFGMSVAILFDNVPQENLNGTEIFTSKSNVLLLLAAFIYFPLLEGIFPILLAIYFWYTTRKLVKRLNNHYMMQRFDRQITRTYMFQIIVNAIASMPFATINLYRSLTNGQTRNENQENIVQFVRLLAICLFHIQYSTNFYIYMITSSEFRIKAFQILSFWHYCQRHSNNRVIHAQI
ncbi:unnamed protein product [Rotaria magnacalcarata]|uniref:G-protein coupled receptors family 1 profile domain-containing protein n=3 Tax=Rotaria magnacalcarata TaxID=392030 RepID=A0A816NJW3_9BILA|nr:unnamed protein product [Rotaria magnacalcarata]CAF2042645.1 unnamed protein product [Rotaria magnacalcarata]CAF3859985.1 unnamed protein product [Rotaria magnacalcarata]CAF3934034.1 unnamed protein product [Rotaria magnacalcarata]